MANSNNKLKAYVRYDGNGRVIPGSLILQRSKPKVGNWQEIDANECCNDLTTTTTSTSTSTTTTTSTSTSTTTTTTTSNVPPVFSQSFLGGSDSTVCNAGEEIILYYTEPLGLGSTLYFDNLLSMPYSGSSGNYLRAYFNAEYNVCIVNGSGVITSASACPA